MPDIQDYIRYIIKKHETLATTPLIHIYIKRIDNILIFKMKDKDKIKLKTPEAMKLFGRTKKSMDKAEKC